MESPETTFALLITATVFHALAVVLTSFRLWFRYHMRRLWWDDFWAALALISDIPCIPLMWLITAPLTNPYLPEVPFGIPPEPQSVHVISFWISLLSYTCSIWFARLSIVVSIVRIVPPNRSVQLAVYITSAMFVLMWGFMLAAKSVVCSMDKSWYYDDIVIQCPMSEWMAISEVCTDSVSDVALVALPLYLLRRLKLPSNQRIMILSVFSTSILVTVVSAVHTGYLIPAATFIAGATAEIEVGTLPSSLRLLLTTVDLDVSARSGTRFTTTDGTRSEFTSTALTDTTYSSLIFPSYERERDDVWGYTAETGAAVVTTADPGPPAIALARR
ncbi:hypothetical protein BU15DRAFT_75765 [Melanogaster broomeanus]|nr:hypothetical protein BU15DRAFT_75765 [Melanogaster broomeanus]